jgi:large subunit ribosomal protein L9
VEVGDPRREAANEHESKDARSMADIQVVLTENDPKLGKKGDVVKVSSGYAQNFLYPHKKALPATPQNLKAFEAEKARHAKEEAEKLERAKTLASKLAKTPLVIGVSTGESDKLYGSVNTQDIQEALARYQIQVERREIHLAEPIKHLGEFTVEVKLHPQVQAAVKVNVVKKA